MNIPLVSEYKISFIIHRLIQTFLGGFGHNGSELEDSWQLINFYRVLLYIYPFLIGLILTLVIEINCLTELFGAITAGVVSFLIMIVIHLLGKRGTFTKIIPTYNGEKFSGSDNRIFAKIMPLAAQKTKLVIILHSTTSSLLICLAVYSLQLRQIYNNFNYNWFTAIVLFILSWLTLIISHHSLTISPPPETATYASTVNTHDLLGSMNRPMQVLIVLIIELINRVGLKDAYNLSTLCPILLSAYPFLWLLGIIPPLPALIQWLAERINVIIFGGGPVCSSVYLLVSQLLSVCVLIFSWVIDEPILTTYVSSVIGFLISNHITSYFKSMKTMKTKFSSLIMLISVLFSILFIDMITTKEILNLLLINRWIVYSMGSLLVLITLIRYSQSVYIFWGLVRNPIYPRSISGIEIFVKFKNKWESVILVMKILLHLILPLLCLTNVNIELKQLFELNLQEMKTNLNSTEKLISFTTSLAIFRVHRSIWQNTYITAFIILFVNFLNHINLKLIFQSLPLQWLIAHFCFNVMISCLEKLYLVVVLTVTSVLLVKQRLSMSWCLLGFNILIAPLIFLMVLVSSIISAPILPLFTLPLFLISFGRPMHFWPDTPSQSELETEDTIYYQQLMSQFVQSLQRQCPLISSCKAGSFLLARFSDRLIWIQVLETGFNYIKIQIKGLELQETSCHAVEATTIDEILEEAFYSSSQSRVRKMFNSHFWYTLQPLDTLIVKTYSDARNVLTGVIDSPETFAAIKSVFARVFVWVILKYRMKKTNNSSIQESVELDLGKQVEDTNTNPNLEANNALFSDVLKAKSQVASQQITSQTNNTVLSEWSDDEAETDVLGSDPNQYRQKSNISYQSNQMTFLNLVTDEKIESNSEPKLKDIDKIESLENQTKTDSMDYNNLKPETSNSEIFAMSNEVEEKSTSDRKSNSDGKNNELNGISSDKLESDDSLKYCYDWLSPTNEWLTASFDYTYRKRINHNLNQFIFSDEWFKNVVDILSHNTAQLTDTQISSLIDSYKQIVLVCFSCILPDSPSIKNQMSPQTIHQIFSGKVPDDGLSRKFLNSNKELYEITIKSFQYSVKIALDQVLLGNEDLTHNELTEVLMDYDTNWYIGDDSSTQWKNSVIEEKRNLFSIGRDPIKECLTSHLLSLEEMVVHLCHLNRGVIEAIWSSLSLELLYLTNDDEERYSIQAHPVILRNVTVQAADAPLGYPVFVSPPILINYLNN